MGTTRLPFSSGLVIGLCALFAVASGPVEGATMDPFAEFSSVDDIRVWAKKSFFGGADTSVYAQGSRELCVVTGRPTSGLISTRIAIFGRAKTSESYRLVLATGVFYTNVTHKADTETIAFYKRDKRLLVVPFDVVTANVARPSGE
jgi:hypothetical protein